MRNDAEYMRRALELAAAGEGLTAPNPMVGAVLVRDGRVVGEGSHTYEGLRHAEAIALDRAGELARGATLYINLEPCSHQGRTPPCADALVGAGVARVVAAMRDPNPLVARRGFARLREAGIAIEEGLLEEQAHKLNEHFVRYIQGGVFVTLKAAMTLDGRIGLPPDPGDPRGRFTCADSLAYVQRLRHAHDAIMTGIGTVLVDDPLLTDRSGLPRRRPLLRVVLDPELRLPLDSRLVQSANGDVLLIANPTRISAEREREFEKRGVRIFSAGGPAGRNACLPDVLACLRAMEVTSVLVEAGSRLNASVLQSGLVDKLILFYAPRLAGSNDTPPLLAPGSQTAGPWPELRVSEVRQIGCDVMVEAYTARGRECAPPRDSEHSGH